MTAVQIAWSGVAVAMVVLVTIVWLKGAFPIIAAAWRKFVRESGEPWTVAAAFEPFGAAVVVFLVAAFAPARPESRWARWFYGGRRMARASERYADEPENDTSADRR